MGKWRKSKAMVLSMQMQESMMISRYQDEVDTKMMQPIVVVRGEDER